MCNRYVPPHMADIERHMLILPRDRMPLTGPAWGPAVYPRAQGPFIRRRRTDPAFSRELVVGQWGLIPHFAKEPKLTYSTNNARSEELAQKASFKGPWARGQRRIIPAWSFDEPCWETGKNVWWTFKRPGGTPWNLAGLWATWTDPHSGEVHESYTMLTLNADAHPLMSRMHKPDPKLPPERQDKRSVIPVADEDVDTWLAGTQVQAQALLKPAAVEEFAACEN